MTNNSDEARRQLDRLADALARDVDRLTDDELLQEAAESYGDPEKAAAEIRGVIEAAIAAHGKRRLMAARHAYEAHTGKVRSKVVELSLEKKRALIDKFAGNDNQLRERLTMAARNEEDSEADIDSFLEDLIELGVIDNEGNVQ